MKNYVIKKGSLYFAGFNTDYSPIFTTLSGAQVYTNRTHASAQSTLLDMTKVWKA